jgi:hypothetical protein
MFYVPEKESHYDKQPVPSLVDNLFREPTDCGAFCSRGITSDLAVSTNSRSVAGQCSFTPIESKVHQSQTGKGIMDLDYLDASGWQLEQALRGLLPEALHPLGVH